MSSYVLVLWLNLADFSLLAIMCYFLFGRPRALSFHISTSWSVTRSLWSLRKVFEDRTNTFLIFTLPRERYLTVHRKWSLVAKIDKWRWREESLEAITDLSIGARRTPSVKEIKTSNKKMSPLFLKGTRCT